MPVFLSNARKQELCRIMSSNLSTIRAKADMTQDELSERLGFARQTISAIENSRRDMQWSTFTAIDLFFSRDNELSRLMSAMGLLDEDVKKILNIAQEG